MVNGFAVVRSLGPVGQAVVALHLGYPEPIVIKHRLPAFGLSHPVQLYIAPLLDARFVFPERQRQHFVRMRKALKPLNGNKSFDGTEFRTQAGRQIQVVFPLASGGECFKITAIIFLFVFETNVDKSLPLYFSL